MAKEADWDAIELDFRAGVMPLTVICKKHDITLSKLRSHADKYMWERKTVSPLNVQAAHGMASTAPTGPKFGMDSNLDEETLVKQAVFTAASVLDTHRKDVAQLRSSSRQFSDALANIFAGLANQETTPDFLDAALMKISILCGEDTPIDVLEKLSRVMVRLVDVERKAYGLDVLPNPDPDDKTDEAARAEINKLWEQVQTLQVTKTATQH